MKNNYKVQSKNPVTEARELLVGLEPPSTSEATILLPAASFSITAAKLHTIGMLRSIWWIASTLYGRTSPNILPSLNILQACSRCRPSSFLSLHYCCREVRIRDLTVHLGLPEGRQIKLAMLHLEGLKLRPPSKVVGLTFQRNGIFISFA